MNEGLSRVDLWMRKLINNKDLQNDLANTFKKSGIVENIVNSSRQHKVRFIRDSLWGNISLSAELHAIVDSPFFQRQRLITKLGFTSLVYPGTTHTQLDHSLGCLYLLQNLLYKPTFSYPKNSYSNEWKHIPIELENIFYGHAVLLHDIALPVYGSSTTSLLLNPQNACFENVSFGKSSLSKLLASAKSELNISKPHWMLEETFNLKILSVIFLSHSLFRKFYDNLWCFVSNNSDLEHKPTVILAGCILGFSINDNKNLFWDLYHGPFGVKTIDELVRDTRNCGVKSPIDHQRMLHSANVTFIPKDYTSNDNYDIKHPPEFRALVIDQFDPYVFKELKMAIELIKSRVYSHSWRKAFKDLYHTMLLSRAQDGLVVNEDTSNSNSLDYLKLWATFEEKVLDECQSSANQQTSLIASRLIFRQTPKRCFSLGQHSFEIKGVDFIKDEQKNNHKILQKINFLMFEKIVDYFDNVSQAQTFILEAKKQMVKVLKAIKHGNKSIMESDIELYVCLNNSADDHDVCPIGFVEEGKNNYTRKELIENDTKSIHNNAIFFYTTHEMAEVLYLVLKKMIYKYFVLNTETVETLFKEKNWGKLDDKDYLIRPHVKSDQIIKVCDLRGDKIAKYEATLSKTAFYDDCATICELNNELRSKLKDKHEIFSPYQGEGGYNVNKNSLIAYIEQFPPKYRNEVYHMIFAIKVLSRETLIDFLKKSINQLKEKYDNVLLVPLSESSGKQMKAMLGETSKGVYSCKSMPDALSSAYEKVKDTNFCIMIYDDNLISGTQALSQFRFWNNGKPNSEENINTTFLNKQQLKKLKEIDLYFSFHITWSYGRKKLKDYLTKNAYKINETAISYNIDIEELSNLGLNSNLKNYLRKVGKEVYGQKLRLRNNFIDKKIESKAAKRALGFDNLEGLFITGLNVPTATVTALWCPGIVTINDISFSWKPLLIRTNSLKNFVW